MSFSPRSLQQLLATLPVAPVAVALSALFSALVILQHPLLNDDAYSYLRAAEAFNTRGALAVLESFGWYNYSFLIALLDQVLPGGMIAAAHLLNTACYALLTWAFIQLSSELGSTRRVQGFAALCILCLPLVNEMRYFLIRDAGFWAFALLSLVFLIRYGRTGHMLTALWWCLSLCAATAFRLEGMMLLLLAPLSLLLPEGTLSTGERTMRCVQLHGIALATLTAVVLVTLLAGISLIDLIAYSYRYYLPLLADLFTSGNLPGSDNTAPGFVMLLSGDVLALLTNLINALSLPLVVLMLFSRYAHGPAALPPTSRRALLVYISIATLALVLFLLIMHFMTQRYTTLLSLLLLSFVPLVLDRLYTQAQERGTLKRFMGIVSVFIFYYLIDSLFSFGYSQQHVEEGVAWTRENLPAEAQLRTNNFAIAYHSGRIPDYDLTVRAIVNVLQSSTSGDYLVLEIDHDDDASALDNTLLYLPLTRFANERGDEVRVYQRQ